MNKINKVILSFLTIAYSESHAMTVFSSKELDAKQKDAVIQVMGSFKLANNIKNSFLRLKDFNEGMSEAAKILKITAVLTSYQDAHARFIRSRYLCNPENLSPKYLREYCFCDFSTQDKFQAKADALLGGYVLDLHQWFEEMRSVEYETLLIPYRLING